MAQNLKGMTFDELNALYKKQMTEYRSATQGVANARGKDARIARYNARLAGPQTWRQLKGVPLMIHEIKHVGNRPFSWGFATIALLTVYVQTKFTDEQRANSLYWSTFQMKK